MLLDAAVLDTADVAKRMSRRPLAADPVDAAGWIDGFLTGDAVVLIDDVILLGLLDDWIAGTDTALFDDVLPLLRRTFSAFGAAERAMIGRRVSQETVAAVAASDRIDVAQARAALRAVARLIGWEAVS